MQRALVAILALAALGSVAAASIVLRVTPRELADTAGLVVEGRVTAVDVRWNAEHTAINTYVSMNVERTHKGTPVGTVVVKVPGGRVGEDELHVEGTASFRVDERIVIFLWKDGEKEWIVLGEAQGKFTLFRDKPDSDLMAENSLKGLCLVVRGDPSGTDARRARRADRVTYDALVEVIRASVAASRDTKPTTGGPTTTGAGGGGTATTPPDGGDGGGTVQPPAGRDPAPPGTPDPPRTTESSDEEAPPPSKDDPAPPAGKSDTPEGEKTPPAKK